LAVLKVRVGTVVRVLRQLAEDLQERAEDKRYAPAVSSRPAGCGCRLEAVAHGRGIAKILYNNVEEVPS
jgi:hypothetical protein